MSGFEIPDWAQAPAPDAPPPPDPMVVREQQIADATRAEQGLNRFLAAKQSALFEAPDAFYRAQGEDAIHALPGTTQKLDELRRDLLDRLGNDTQRERLADALDAQMHLAREGMARHVAEQSLAWQRGVAQDRIALLAKEAAHHHNDDELIDSLGHAAATAARAHARVGAGPPGGDAEDAAAAAARSGVLGAAIQARLDRGDTQGANALFTQVQDQLDPEHAAPLQGQIDAGLVRVLPYRPSLDGSGYKAVPLPYKPPVDGTLDNALILKNLADVPEGENTPGQNSGGIVSVNATPDDAIGAAKADPQLAQASPNGKKENTDGSRHFPETEPPPGSKEHEAAKEEAESIDPNLDTVETAIGANRHWIESSGKALQYPFDKIDTASVQPEQFPAVQEKLKTGTPGNTYKIQGTMPFHTNNDKREWWDPRRISEQNDNPRWIVGNITLKLDGELVIHPDGSHSFNGKLSALPDLYDMNRSNHRDGVEEFMTTVGRVEGETLGHTNYRIHFRGEKPLSSSSNPTK